MLKKKQLIIAFTLVFILSTSVLTFANTTDLEFQSKSSVLMEASTGKVLYQDNIHEKLPLASITKVMTLLLIYEAVDNGRIQWDDVVAISEHAASMGGSQVFLEVGEEQTVKELTKCISIASANDASVAMAEHISGSESKFVDMMNERAKELKMENTNFMNACGLDADGHVSSSYDIAIMSRQLINNYPEISENATTWMDTITHKTRNGEKEFGLTNTNRLVKWYKGATGLKTGSTGKALFCLSGTANRDGMNLVAVVMGAPNSSTRFSEVMQLLDYGFANYSVLKGHETGEVVGEAEVFKGLLRTVPVTIKDEVSTVVKKGGGNDLEWEIVMFDNVNAPFEIGEKAGEIIYSISGNEVSRSDLITIDSMKKIGFIGMCERIVEKWFD